MRALMGTCRLGQHAGGQLELATSRCGAGAAAGQQQHLMSACGRRRSLEDGKQRRLAAVHDALAADSTTRTSGMTATAW
jgi:hypothetical protein